MPRDQHYPQALIDSVSRAGETLIQPDLRKLFVGRGPINRLTFKELHMIVLRCRRPFSNLAFGFMMGVFSLLEEHLIEYERLTPEQVELIKDECMLESAQAAL